MNFLNKLYFLNPLKSNIKLELYISSVSINFLSWYKGEGTTEGTMVHTVLNNNDLNHLVEGTPENVNQISYDGLFFKCTCHRIDDNGGMKKFSAWINTENIVSMYSEMPDDTKVFFRSGYCILVTNKMTDLLKAILEHTKKIKERKKQKYGK